MLSDNINLRFVFGKCRYLLQRVENNCWFWSSKKGENGKTDCQTSSLNLQNQTVMNSLGKNEELLDRMRISKLYLLDSRLMKIEIFEHEYSVQAELHFRLTHGDELLIIRFTEIAEYCFYYRSEYSFYNVERCKFFKSGELFYVSIDPYDETEEINGADQDFILCKNIEGYM